MIEQLLATVVVVRVAAAVTTITTTLKTMVEEVVADIEGAKDDWGAEGLVRMKVLMMRDRVDSTCWDENK